MAAGNMKQIRRRIKSVQSTMQITKAMELVASSKVRRAKERVNRARPYFTTLYNTMNRIAKADNGTKSIYMEQREVKKSLYIVIAGDRGLAGGYNSNIFKTAMADMKDKNCSVIAVGKKASEFFAKRDIELVSSYLDIAETMKISDTHKIVAQYLDLYKNGEIDEVYVAYTEYVSPLTQEAKLMKLLPISFEEEIEEAKSKVLTEYDPSPEAVFNSIIPEYLNGVLFGAVVESYASEQSARRMAMESASDNAGEMIERLNLSYNRARQASITQEITEIVAGSGAVGG